MCFLLLNGSIPKGLRAIKGSTSALYSEVKFKPYWDLDLHISAPLTILGHSLRALNNLVHLAMYTVSVVPILFCSPCEIPVLPVVIAEHLLAATISALAAVITPVLFAFRTLASLFCDYQENSSFDWDWASSEQEEHDDWKKGMNPFIPSALCGE